MTEKQLLTAAAIREIDDRNYRVVDVPEWGGAIRVRSPSLEESMADGDFVPENDDAASSTDRCLSLIIKYAIDEHGQPLFVEEDKQWLGKRNPAPLMRIAQAIARIASPDNDSVEEAEQD